MPTLEFIINPPPGDASLTAASDQYVPGGGGTGVVPNGWLDVKAYGGAKGDGVTDDTTAIQNTINAVHATAGGTVYFPPGTYLITTALSLNNMYGIRLFGAGPSMQYQTGPSIITFNGNSGHLLTMYSSSNCEVAYLQFDYTSATYAGDLIDIDGSVFHADVQDCHIHHCSTRCNRAGAITARSMIRLNAAVINHIDHCHITGGIWGIRLGDPGGTYVNVQYIENCTFNTPGTAHIFVGTPDGENIVIAKCSFEGSYTAIYGSTAARDGGNCACPSFLVEGCWFGDAAGTINWIDGVGCPGTSFGIIRDNYFYETLGKHLTLAGAWLVEGNTFTDGSAVYASPTAYGLTFLIDIANNYNTPTAIYDPTTVPQIPLGSSWGNKTGASNSENRATNQIGVTAINNLIAPGSGDGDLILGAQLGASGYEAAGTHAFVYKLGGGKIVVQAPYNGSASNIDLVTGSGPAPVVSMGIQTLGFFGATPATQPATAGSSTGYAAGATAATFHSDDTYTGNVGTTAYTINGIVAALKNLGLIKA